MRRPLFAVAISMIAGIFYSDCFGLWLSLVMALASAAILFYMGKNIIIKPEIFRSSIMITAAFLAGAMMVSVAGWGMDNSPLNSMTGKSVRYQATVSRIEKVDDEKYRLTCDVKTADDEKSNGKLLITYYRALKDTAELWGRTISFTSSIEVPLSAGNPRCFDYQKFLRSKSIGFTGSISAFWIDDSYSSTVIENLKGTAVRFIVRRRDGFTASLGGSEWTRAFAEGVLFGEKSEMDDEIYQDFKNNGTAHVLAVSGLHVGMLFGMYRKLTKKRRGKLQIAAFAAILMVYGTATLWAVPVTRAILLIVIMLAGDLLDRRYDMLTALSAAAVIILTLNPYAVTAAGFQMSFLAVMSMAFFGPVIERVTGPSIGMIIGVQLGLIPYIAYTFNYISLFSLICNLPIVYLVSIFVPCGITFFLIYFVSGFFIFPEGLIMSSLGSLIVKLNHLLSHDGAFAVNVVSPPLWTIVLIYGIAFYCTSEYFQVYIHRRNLKAMLLPLVLIIVAAMSGAVAGGTPFDKMDVVFADVGQGDCMHLKCAGRTDVLIDGGGSADYDIGEKTLKPYLLHNGVADIDLAMATHLHTDHFLGLTQLSQSYNVRKFMTRGTAGVMVKFADGQWAEVLWPEKYLENAADENTNSLIFKVHMHGLTILVTGDIGEEGERALVEKYAGTDKLKCDVLKVAHHGSRFSTCDEFLEAVDPLIAVVSVGKNNYGHPAPEVIEKMQKKGIIVFRTDHSGAVGMRKSKGKIDICTEREQ